MQYNSQKEHLRMPAYGRIVQELADELQKITDPRSYAHAEHQLLETMARVSGHNNLNPENENMLRTHLARILKK